MRDGGIIVRYLCDRSGWDFRAIERALQLQKIQSTRSDVVT
jgi:hypothetical protein